MPSVARKLDDRFTQGMLRAATPIAIWGVHFFIAYWVVQFACQLNLQQYSTLGVSVITIALWILTAAAIATLAVMTVLNGRKYRRQEGSHEDLLLFVQIGAAIFALVGVLWSAVPILVSAPCANLYELKAR